MKHLAAIPHATCQVDLYRATSAAGGGCADGARSEMDARYWIVGRMAHTPAGRVSASQPSGGVRRALKERRNEQGYNVQDMRRGQ